MSSQPFPNKEQGRAGIGRGGLSSWKFTHFVVTPKLSALKTLTNNISLSKIYLSIYLVKLVKRQKEDHELEGE